MSGATPKVNTAQEGAENSIPIKCGQKTAVFYPMKMKGMGKQGKGKQVGKCVQFQGKWLTPNEFERIAGATAKKWKQSIKHDGKPLGEWLALNAVHETIGCQKHMQTKHTVKHQSIYMIMLVMLSLTMSHCQAIALRVGQLTVVHVYTQILKSQTMR